MKVITPGTKFNLRKTVKEEFLASNVGSGNVNVYATPMMVALMEECAVACIQDYMEEGETTVGISMNTTHDAATPCGMDVYAEAEVISVAGKKITFSILAKDEVDVIGKATHERFLVLKDKFEQRASAKRK